MLPNAARRWTTFLLLVLASVFSPAFASEPEPTRGFTGKRVYHMFSKSWIDGDAITDPSWIARKIKLDVNVEPTTASIGDAFDYKIYQSFTVEVQFRDGKIIHADFVRGTELQRANTTLGLRGEVRMTGRHVIISEDRSQVLFVRQIEGNPHLAIKAADLALAKAVAASWSLNLDASEIKIYNAMQLTVTAEGAEPVGAGSPFPTHYFWIKSGAGQPQRFATQTQVQPSEFFEPVGSNAAVRPLKPKAPIHLPPRVHLQPPHDIPRRVQPSVTARLNEIAERACGAPHAISADWLDTSRYAWLPTGESIDDDRSSSLSGCAKELFVDLLQWNALKHPPKLDSDWLRSRIHAYTASERTASVFSNEPCGQPCSTKAPANGQSLRDWCIRSCGCKAYDATTQQCVP